MEEEEQETEEKLNDQVQNYFIHKYMHKSYDQHVGNELHSVRAGEYSGCLMQSRTVLTKKRCGPCRSEGGHSFFLIAWDVPFCLHYKCKVYAWPPISLNLNTKGNMISIAISTHVHYAPLFALEYSLLN